MPLRSDLVHCKNFFFISFDKPLPTFNFSLHSCIWSLFLDVPLQPG